MGQLLIARQTHALLEPVMNLARRKPPLAGDFAAGQVAPLGQPRDPRRIQVQIGRQIIDVEVFVGHGSTCSLASNEMPADAKVCRSAARCSNLYTLSRPCGPLEQPGETCLDTSREIATIPPPLGAGVGPE